MSILADIHAYWASNSTLDAALSHTKVYTGLAPETLAFPFAVIVPIGMIPSPLTGPGYVELFDFQISIFDSNPDNVDNLANLVTGQFDYKNITATTVSCERKNGPVFFVDQDSPKRVYHAMIEYELRENKSLPDN
jgi:hypothetical protein